MPRHHPIFVLQFMPPSSLYVFQIPGQNQGRQNSPFFLDTCDTQLMHLIQTHKLVRIVAQKWSERRLISDEFVGLNNAHQLRIAVLKKKL